MSAPIAVEDKASAIGMLKAGNAHWCRLRRNHKGVREFSWLNDGRRTAMQMLLGIILGVLIAIGAAFVYDSSTGRAANGLTVASAEGHAPMVNWDVVSHNWDGMKQQLRDVAIGIEKGWKRVTG